MTQGAPPADMKLQRTSRDAADVPARLGGWLATVLPEGSDPEVALLSGTDANGMSSETLVLDAAWTEDGRSQEGQFVARVEPSHDDLPVFPTYALQDQYDVIAYVGEHTDVPVPIVRWSEPTGSVLGTPFFLMDRVDGLVPQDVLPYNFGDNWLFDASEEQQRRLQDDSVAVLAGLHAIPDAESVLGYLDPARHGHEGATPLLRNLARTQAWYEFAVPDIGRSPTVERALAWLTSTVPATDETVLCWGDARIGNVHLRRLPARCGARLGDGHAGSARARRVVDGLRAPRLRGDHRGPGAARDAGLPARGRRAGDVRAADRGRAWATSAGSTSTTRCSGASSSCARARGRSTSARSSGPTTSRPCSTTSRSWTSSWRT